jgi:hypothetical protein
MPRPGQCVGVVPVDVDLDRVIDHQIDVHQRIDLGGIAPKLDHRVAARRDVHDGRNAGEVLKDHPCRDERNLAALGLRGPGRHGGDVGVGDQKAVVVAQRRLQEDADRVRKFGERGQTLLLERGETKIGPLAPTAQRKRRARSVRVLFGHGRAPYTTATALRIAPPTRPREGASRGPGTGGSPAPRATQTLRATLRGSADRRTPRCPLAPSSSCPRRT